jgi:hypothetical protein
MAGSSPARTTEAGAPAPPMSPNRERAHGPRSCKLELRRSVRAERAAFGWNRLCEERSDEAIQRTWAPYVPWIAASAFGLLAMTIPREGGALLAGGGLAEFRALLYRARLLLPTTNRGTAIAATRSPMAIKPAGVARAVASSDTEFPIRNRTVARISSG